MNTEKGVRTVTVINLVLLILLILSPFICIEIYARQIMPTPILIARCLEVSSFIKFNRTECPISNHYCKWENFWKTKGKGLRAWCFSKAVLFLSSGLLPRQRRCGNCINIGYFSTRIWFAHFRGSVNWRKKRNKLRISPPGAEVKRLVLIQLLYRKRLTWSLIYFRLIFISFK